MAKRTNPFEEDFVQQSKVHVGMKQFNNNEDRLKKVYEKTLQLLFKGAKKAVTQDVINSTDNELNTTEKRDKMKQLFIGKNLTLSHSGNMIDEKASAKHCNCGGGADSRCAYCEVLLCGICQHHCSHCEGNYCSHCTLNGLEGTEVCKSCYG